MAKRALPLLTGGLNELARPDLIENSQLQVCDNYEIIGDGTLHRRKDPEQFDPELDDFLFTEDTGLFWESDSSIISISEPYYLPTDIDLTNKAEYSSMATDHILLLYGSKVVNGDTTYQLHILYKVNKTNDSTAWTNDAEFTADGTETSLYDLLTDAGIVYTSSSEPQFAFADDKIIITDNVNNAHFVAVDKDGFVRAGKLGLPAPKNRPRIEQMTSVDKTLFEPTSTETYISTPGLVQVTYTAVTKFGDESNPAPLSPTLDMQYQKINTDGTVEHYLDKIKVSDLTVPDVPDNIMEILKSFNFYIRVIPYRSGDGVVDIRFSEQKEILNKAVTGTDTGNDYVLSVPSAGSSVSYENDVAPIAKTAAHLSGITMLGNVKTAVRFPWSFKYFHPIQINNLDTANYVDANMIIRLYDKDSTESDATPIENFAISDFITDTVETASFKNGGYFRLFDEDLTTPLYAGFPIADFDGSPTSFKVSGDSKSSKGSDAFQYIDLIIQIPYLMAVSAKTIYLCWTPESEQDSYSGVPDEYNQLLTDDITWEGNIGIHYGTVMNINSSGFSRQQFFKGTMVENDRTYLSYPFELEYDDKKINRVNLNNKILHGDPDTNADDPAQVQTAYVNNTSGIATVTRTHIRGFRVDDDSSYYRINTGEGTVGARALKLTGLTSGVYLNANQFNGASLSGKAGHVSFWYDITEDTPFNDGNTTEQLNLEYNICTIWGEVPLQDPNQTVQKAIRLFARRKMPQEDDFSSDNDKYFLYLDGWQSKHSTASKYWLGNDFEVADRDGDVVERNGIRYIVITWKSDQSEVTVWSCNLEGRIYHKTVEWGFSEKITDGSFYGVVLGTTVPDPTTTYAGMDLPKSADDVVYDDINFQIGEYLDPSYADSYAKFANMVNQFPAYDNMLGYKHAAGGDNVSYNNNISFSETEMTEEKERKNMVRWTDVNYNSFPDLFFKTVREPVTRIVPAPSFLQYQYQNTFLIYTRNSINRFVLEGSASGWQGSASSLIEEKTQYGLFAPDTLVRVGDVLFWLSEVGVMMWGKDGLGLISKNIIDIDMDKSYFAYENSIRNQYILCQSYDANETQFQYVYHVDRNIWTRFHSMGIFGITKAVSLTGGEQTDNINLIFQNNDERSFLKYPGSSYTADESTIQTKEMFFEKGTLRRIKASYSGESKSFSSILTKDNSSRDEMTRTHTVAMDSNEWRGVPLGYNRGKSVSFRIENADTIESIMYDLDIEAKVVF